MEKIKTILTGATSGIGYQTALQLLEINHHLILANRNKEKAIKVKQSLIAKFPNAEIDLLTLDLASFKSIEDFIKELKNNYSKIDILINNAGVLSRKEQYTEEGFEVTLGVNYIGTYYLTELILEVYNYNMPKKIIFVSSIGCYFGNIKIRPNFFYKRRGTFRNYFDSKLANLVYVKELSEKLSNKSIEVKAADPGVVFSQIWKWKTSFGKSFIKIQKKLMKTPAEGVKPILKIINDDLYKNNDYILFTYKKGRKLPKKIQSKNVRINFTKYTEKTIQEVTNSL